MSLDDVRALQGLTPQTTQNPRIQQQINLILNDFQQTYFNFVGNCVSMWCGLDRNSRQLPFYAAQATAEQERFNRTLARANIANLQGEVQGIGDVLALRLYQNFNVDPNRVRHDIGDAVETIRSGQLVNGVKKLGYWSGFSRAMTY